MGDTVERLQVVYVPRTQLRPYEGNPRRISEHGLRDLRRSLREFGWTNPGLVQHGTDMVIAGHQRLKAAEAEGIDEVPVLYLDMGDLEARAYLVADNRLQESSTWVDDKLDALLEDLRAGGFDVTLTGFSEADLEERIGAPEEPAGADDVPAVGPDVIASRPGDLWVLEGARATHRLLCGDSTSEPDVLRLMAGARAALVATDPPYLVDYTGADRAGSGKDWSSEYDEAAIEARAGGAVTFWRAALKCALAVAEDGVPDSDVWELDWEGKKRPTGAEHPTQKPVEIFAIPMRKHTKPGDICYEPFSGSGSQIIAGELAGRCVYALEISPHFVDVAVKRWQMLTGRQARREADGVLWDDVMSQAEADAMAAGAARKK